MMRSHKGRIFALALLIAGFAGGQEPHRNFIVLCAGDSLTARGYPPLLGKSLRREGIRARVLNYGRSGFTTAEYLRFLKTGAEKLKNERPDIILLELGTNDVRIDGDRVPRKDFERNLREIISIFRGFETRTGGSPAIFLASIPPVPEWAPYPFGPESVRRVDSEINPSIRSLCLEMKTHFVDNHSIFLESPDLLPGVHPSREGYKAMALNWLKAMMPLMKAR